MHLGHQRAGGVDNLEATRLARLANRRGDAVSRIDYALTRRNFLDFVNKNCAFFRQLIHHKAIVNNLPAYVNRGAKGIQGDLHNVDGANDTGAKATGFEQQDTLLTGNLIGTAKVGDGF